MSVASHSSIQPAGTPPGAVLDTNVVLAWLLFEDPRVAPLASAVQAGTVGWLATDDMIAEVAQMLGHESLRRWPADRQAAFATVQRLARVLQPSSVPSLGRPRCSDPDDQIFVDLAISSGARWLVSRDRAVLKMKRRMMTYGVTVISPEHWPRGD